MDYETMKAALECMSGGTNTLIMDDAGRPSVMVRIPKLTYADLGIGDSPETHPAFIVDGVEKDYFYVSKYQNHIKDGKAYSMPGHDPAAGNVDLDTAHNACFSKGRGWHLMTNAEWAAVALWCRKNGFLPHGNNDYGKDYANHHERCIVTTQDAADPSLPGRCISGSGPLTWFHDASVTGICDMNGNVWEYIAGSGSVGGEIRVIPNNDAAILPDISQSNGFWRAVMPDGRLVSPGTPGTLKWDYIDHVQSGETDLFYLNTTVEHMQTDDRLFGSCRFADLRAKPGVAVPDLLKALAIMPDGKDGYGDAYVWIRNGEERVTTRGGCWTRRDTSGIFALNMFGPGTHTASAVGFRACYVEL